MRAPFAVVVSLVLAFSVATPLTLAGCYETSDRDVEGLELDCIDIACPWTTDTGSPRFGSTWHDGDIGVDLSAPGPISVSTKVVLIGRNSRQFDISAALFRDPDVGLHFDWEFYGDGDGTGDTFWERSPPLLGTDTTVATDVDAFVLHRHVAVPPETAAFVLHLRKEGEGRALVDQLTVDHFDHVRSN